MAALADTHPTLLDLARRTDPDGNIADIVEILNQTNPVLTDMVWLEGNLTTGHRTTVRSGLPAPTWRKMYGGVQPTKSKTVQITDNTGMLEAYAEVDKALADLNGNTAAWRLSEEAPHIEGISQEIAQTIFYGNEGTEPEAFTGFAPRYNSLSAQNAANIIDAGNSTGNLRSIWLIVWGPNSTHGIVPKGSKAGLQMEDKGQVTIENADGAGGRMEAYRTHYRQDAGLTLRDWRQVVRIANIDQASLVKEPGASDVDLSELMFQAIEQVNSLESGRAVFYMPRALITKLRQQTSTARKASDLGVKDVGGTMMYDFHGVPVRRTDALAVDEARVV